MKQRIIFQLVYLLTTPFTMSQAHAQIRDANQHWPAGDNGRLSRENASITSVVHKGPTSQAH